LLSGFGAPAPLIKLIFQKTALDWPVKEHDLLRGPQADLFDELEVPAEYIRIVTQKVLLERIPDLFVQGDKLFFLVLIEPLADKRF
jgi:hypothetical protein